MASTLSRWLRTLDSDQLAGLLARRPEALTAPVPRTLGELAGRLQGRLGVAAAFGSVPLPAVQVLEAVLAYSCRTRDDLAALLGGDGLDGALATLADRALLWEFEGQLAVAGEVTSGLGYPLGLGPGAADLMDRRTVGELRAIGTALGLSAPARLASLPKKHVLRDLAGFYEDPAGIRALAASAPPDTGEVLDALAWHGPVLRSPAATFGGPAGLRYAGPAEWAVRRGLLSPDGWQQLAMPREVALALRGPDWRPPFDPRPPRPALVTSEPAAVAREAAAAAGALVDQVSTLLAAGPLARLKTGGVGTREQRRVARLIGADEPAVRLAVELAYGAGLLAATPDEVLPTEAYDDWSAAEPAQRLPPLLVAWYRLPAAPLRDGAALTREPVGRLVADLRLDLMTVAAELPEGMGLADESELVPAIRWRSPLLAGSFEDLEEFIRPLWSEAARLGLVAHGTLTALGRALVAMDAAGLGQAADELLETASTSAIFQADLTAVVPGTPSAGLAALLDGAADRETRGAASIWRFNPGSVRRALDAGQPVDELLAALRDAAADRALPQPLEYLLTDVARRHGQVRVRSVGCVLHAEDPAMLAELLASRPLAALRLHRLAPTVLASAASRKDTLAALRSAGYAPLGEDGSGAPLVERAERRRATPPARSRAARRTEVEPAADPAVLAKALLAVPEPVPVPVPAARRPGPQREGTGTQEVIDARAGQLGPDERRLLAYAIDSRTPVLIGYVDGDGQYSTRIIEEIELAGAAIEAWCRLREDERMFLLDRIEAVAPV